MKQNQNENLEAYTHIDMQRYAVLKIDDMALFHLNCIKNYK